MYVQEEAQEEVVLESGATFGESEEEDEDKVEREELRRKIMETDQIQDETERRAAIAKLMAENMVVTHTESFIS